MAEMKEKAAAILQDQLGRARAISEAVYVKSIDVRNQALAKVGVSPEDIAKLNKVPLVVAVAGFVINIVLMLAMGNYAWLKATALSAGQPFTAYLSLTDVKFGTPADPSADNLYFCEGSGACSLSYLCAKQDDAATFSNGIPKYTPAEAWCTAKSAGSMALTLLWVGFIPGLAAMALTFLYAAKEIAIFQEVVLKVESQMNVSEATQKMVIAGCWGALWLFLFVSLTVYASMVPDSLGWGTVQLEASFGLLRFAFVLVSIFGALLVSNLFTLWDAGNVIEAWMEFTEAKLFSAKKALYLLLFLQLGLYLLLVVSYVDWSGLLIVLAGFYLDAKNKNFLLMYLVLVSISILFDVIHMASLPSSANMTPGEGFGASLFNVIFFLKFLIIGMIYTYEKYEKESDGEGGGAWNQLEMGGRDDEIAE